MSEKDENMNEKALDEALARFTDNLLSDEDVEFSDDPEMNALQETVQQFHRIVADDPEISVRLQKIKQSIKSQKLSSNRSAQKEEKKMSWFGKYGKLSKLYRQVPQWATGLAALIILVGAVALLGNSGGLFGTAVLNNGITAPKTTLVTSSQQTISNGESKNPALNGSGRFLVFQSKATNLDIPTDPGVWQIYLYDRARDFNQLISRSANEGAGGNGDSSWPAISADGRYILFQSKGTNLVAENVDGVMNQLYLYDRVTGETILISKSNNQAGNGDSQMGSISGDGGFVVFESTATNLTANGTMMTQIYLYERRTNQLKMISSPDDGYNVMPVISDNGEWIGYQSQQVTAGQSVNQLLWELKLYNRVTGEQKTVMNGAGAPVWGRNIDLSEDGSFVVFESSMADLVDGDANQSIDIFLYEQSNQAITVVSQRDRPILGPVLGNGDSQDPVISADGTLVAFSSLSTNLVSDVETVGIILWNRADGGLQSMNFDSEMQNGDLGSFQPAISDDGRFVAFWSLATNLYNKVVDTNNQADLFLRDLNPDPGIAKADFIFSPGSIIKLDVSHFQPNSELLVEVNGKIVGQINSGELGQATFLLDAVEADPGNYIVALKSADLNVNKVATTGFQINQTGVDVPADPSTINMQSYIIPSGIGMNEKQMIPFLMGP